MLMPKYDALKDHLSAVETDEWNASFAEIERILGFGLPASASKYPAWWANQAGPGHSQSDSWQQAGWQTCDLNLARRQVCFRRSKPKGRLKYDAAATPSYQRLAEEARRFSGIENEEDLMREGLKALIEREAARRLAELGGTMPDFLPAPRRRGE
jgi:hypothetical protein